MTSIPRVSVVIPCYNLGLFLGEAIESVRRQTFDDLELLIVDDGSTDEETRTILAGYHERGVHVLRSTNRGLPGAKNLGLAHSRGAFVCMLDADDRLESSMLEKSVALLDTDSSIAFVSHWLRTFGDETWEWTPASCDFPALLDTNTVNGAALVRRSALEVAGGFDENFRDGCEDWDLWISLVERGFKGVIIPEFLFQYRRRADSMSKKMMRGDGHPRLYRRLASKHVDSYRQHLPALLLRREGDLSNLKRHIHDLELEYEDWLEPALSKARDDLTILRRQAESVRADLPAQTASTKAEAAQQRLQGLLDAAAVDLASVRAELRERTDALETARVRALELDAAANRARGEVQELRASASWRITSPLRAIYGFLQKAPPTAVEGECGGKI